MRVSPSAAGGAIAADCLSTWIVWPAGSLITSDDFVHWISGRVVKEAGLLLGWLVDSMFYLILSIVRVDSRPISSNKRPFGGKQTC